MNFICLVSLGKSVQRNYINYLGLIHTNTDFSKTDYYYHGHLRNSLGLRLVKIYPFSINPIGVDGGSGQKANSDSPGPITDNQIS